MFTLNTTDKQARKTRRRQKLLAFESEMDHSEAPEKSEDTAVPKKKKLKKKRTKNDRKISNENVNLSQSSVELEPSKLNETDKESVPGNRKKLRVRRTLKDIDNTTNAEMSTNISVQSSQIVPQTSEETEVNNLCNNSGHSVSADQKKIKTRNSNKTSNADTAMPTRHNENSLLHKDLVDTLNTSKSSVHTSQILNDDDKQSIIMNQKKHKLKKSLKNIDNTTLLTDMSTKLDKSSSQFIDSKLSTQSSVESEPNNLSDVRKQATGGNRKLVRVRRRLRDGNGSTNIETDVSTHDDTTSLKDSKISFVKEGAPSPSPKKLVKQGTFTRSPKNIPKLQQDETIQEYDTFEMEEPVMPSNKRKSELYNLSTRKSKVNKTSHDLSVNLLDNNNTLGKELPPWNDGSLIDLSLNNTNKSVSKSRGHLKSEALKTKTLHVNTPPSGTSTPALTTKTFKFPLNKSASSKDLNLSSTKKSKTPRVKMPNYALIHQNSFNKMESVEEHLLRKQKRAEALLSGSKVTVGQHNARRQKDAESRKQLQFNSTGTPKKNVQFGPVHSKTPIRLAGTPKKHVAPVHLESPKRHATAPKKTQQSVSLVSKTSDKLVATPKEVQLNHSKIILGPRKSAMKSVTNVAKKGVLFSNTIDHFSPDKRFSTPTKSNVSIKMRIKTPGKVKSPVKEIVKQRSTIPRPIQQVSRFGFKLTTESADTKLDIIKAVATKTRVMKNKVEERRNVIKGVRSNRRFDLLMNMRQKK